MSIDASTFETVVPSRYLTFTFDDHHLHVAVLDSPYSHPSSSAAAATAAIWVPPGRESDWVFSTFSGHLQLLLSSATTQPLSRLILFGRSPSPLHLGPYNSHPSPTLPPLENLAPILSALIPKSAFPNIDGEVPDIPFLIYDDEVVRSSVLEIRQGPRVGEMLVENVELDNNGAREFRRRLRFKRTPNLVQSQMRIRPINGSQCKDIDKMEFELDKAVLVQPYLIPMVAAISVISGFLEVHVIRAGLRPKAMCLGVGGGALLGFLSAQLNFEVVGIEEDEAVLGVASTYFGLGGDEMVTATRLFAQDGIEYVKNLAANCGGGESSGCEFHAIMVDLDSSDVRRGVFAPPVEFVEKSVLLAVRDVVCEGGVVVVNTMVGEEMEYERLVRGFGEVFDGLYEIDVGNGENVVLIATKCEVGSCGWGDGGTFLKKLRSVVSGCYTDSIRKIQP